MLNPAWQESGTDGSGTTAPTSDTTTTASQTSATTETSTTAVDPTATATSTTTTTTTGDTTTDGATTDTGTTGSPACVDLPPADTIQLEFPWLNCNSKNFWAKAIGPQSFTSCSDPDCSVCDPMKPFELSPHYPTFSPDQCYHFDVTLADSAIYESGCQLVYLIVLDTANENLATFVASSAKAIPSILSESLGECQGPIADGSELCSCVDQVPNCCGDMRLLDLNFLDAQSQLLATVAAGKSLDIALAAGKYAAKNIRSFEMFTGVPYGSCDTNQEHQWVDWTLTLVP
ncbi:MAG TPA: hypothetical protein PKW35_08015 [Nannocystaceae bacterium]|nr:hypothetical protein [Nannocystaceae bacterium]